MNWRRRLGTASKKVVPITSIDVLIDHYGKDWLTPDLKQEMTALIDRINAVGVNALSGLPLTTSSKMCAVCTTPTLTTVRCS